jgi:hypothetical protein
MEALASQEQYGTVRDLAAAISSNGDRLDLHNVTHVLYSLKKENKITFDKGSTKDKVPYNIRLVKIMHVREATREELQNPWIEPVALTVVEDDMIFPVTSPDTQEFPVIQRLVNRRSRLEEAARLAEEANETDLALSLLERASAEVSPLETEAIKLYGLYKECLSR